MEASDRAGVRVGRSLPARGVPALCGLAFLPKAKAAGEAHAYARMATPDTEAPCRSTTLMT